MQLQTGLPRGEQQPLHRAVPDEHPPCVALVRSRVETLEHRKPCGSDEFDFGQVEHHPSGRTQPRAGVAPQRRGALSRSISPCTSTLIMSPLIRSVLKRAPADVSSGTPARAAQRVAARKLGTAVMALPSSRWEESQKGAAVHGCPLARCFLVQAVCSTFKQATSVGSTTQRKAARYHNSDSPAVRLSVSTTCFATPDSRRFIRWDASLSNVNASSSDVSCSAMSSPIAFPISRLLSRPRRRVAACSGVPSRSAPPK